MTAGQHKGVMLLTLLGPIGPRHQGGRLRRRQRAARRPACLRPSAVVGIDATTFHYQREDENVKRFQYGDKDDVTRRWHQLSDTLEAVFD